jgi:hypothetical protein
VDVKGIVFSFTDEEIIAAGGKTGGDSAVQPGDFKLIPVYNQECIDRINAEYGKNDNGGAANKAYYSHLGRAYGDYRSDTSADISANWSAHISDDPEMSLFARDYYSKVGVHGMNMWVDHSYWAGSKGLMSGVHPNVSGSVMEKLESVRTYPDGFAWKYLTKEDDEYDVNRMLWYGEDIFDIDASIDYPYGLFPVEASDYQGWTETNMTLALTKYIMSWEDTYCFDIPVNFSSPQLSDSQIDDIIKAVGGSSSMSEGQKKAVTLALQAVGNGQYSQEHHDHAYLSYQCSRYTSGSGLDKLNGLSTHTCTATDASGFASYIKNKGERGLSIWDTDDFKAHASSWGGWNSAKGALKPGDIIVYYPDFDVTDPEFYGQDAGHHVMVYIGTPTEDLNITWLSRDGQQSFRAYDADGNEIGSDADPESDEAGLFDKVRSAIADPDAPIVFEPGATFKAQYYITFKAGEPIFVDCNRLDQTGNIYLRGGYACTGDPTSGMSETGYFYYADQQLMENIYSGAYMYKYRPGY